MQSTPSPDPVTARRRRPWMACAAMMVAAAALAPVVVAQGQSGAAGAAPAAAPAAPSTSSTQSNTVNSGEPAPATTESEFTTTTTAPTESTATTVAAGTSTRSAASVAPTQLAEVEAIADGSGFDWRAAGVTLHVAYHPDTCCHWGIYDYRDNSVWIGPSAFARSARLRYVVLHELAHAWHWATGRRGQLAADMSPWGYSGNEALEYSADCIATIWGATTNNYWSCPTAAETLVTRRLSGDWT